MNARSEIINLMRGFYALPVVSFLGVSGALERMKADSFAPKDFDDLMVTDRLGALFRYLARLGLLNAYTNGSFSVTPLGTSVFMRYGSFCIVRSYEEYFRTLEAQLHGVSDEYKPKVDRRLNVIGSGQIHKRKFFDTALEIIDDVPIDILIDVGCGDGMFASGVAMKYPNVKIYAVDVAPEALTETEKRFAEHCPNTKIETILSDVRNTGAWLSAIEATPNKRTVISFWFLLHEISGGGTNPIIDLLNTIKSYLPQAEILIGEIVDAGIEAITAHRSMSIMPEYLLFHELSGQGPFTLQQLKELVSASRYRHSREFPIDTVEFNGKLIPANVIYHLY